MPEPPDDVTLDALEALAQLRRQRDEWQEQAVKNLHVVDREIDKVAAERNALRAVLGGLYDVLKRSGSLAEVHAEFPGFRCECRGCWLARIEAAIGTQEGAAREPDPAVGVPAASPSNGSQKPGQEPALLVGAERVSASALSPAASDQVRAEEWLSDSHRPWKWDAEFASETTINRLAAEFAAVRREALERAAQRAETFLWNEIELASEYGARCGDAIRALANEEGR